MSIWFLARPCAWWAGSDVVIRHAGCSAVGAGYYLGADGLGGECYGHGAGGGHANLNFNLSWIHDVIFDKTRGGDAAGDGRPAQIALVGSPAGQDAVRQPLPAGQPSSSLSAQPVPVSSQLSDRANPANTGTTLDIIPVLAPDGSAVDLSVNLQIVRTKPN